jgi:hypothetical protein
MPLLTMRGRTGRASIPYSLAHYLLCLEERVALHFPRGPQPELCGGEVLCMISAVRAVSVVRTVCAVSVIRVVSVMRVEV